MKQTFLSKQVIRLHQHLNCSQETRQEERLSITSAKETQDLHFGHVSSVML